MAVKNYLIAPYASGQQDDVEPWLLPEDAFETLENAYVWRGRVRKRFGYRTIGAGPLESRLRYDLGNTDGSGNISTTAPGVIFKVGQTFSVGTEEFTVTQTGTPANMLTTGAATTATFDTTSGAVVINGAAAGTALFFYPSEPVMGLTLREQSTINFEETIAFDTQFSYLRSASAWTQVDATAWTGSNSDFFWTTNYRGANPYDTNLYVTNFVAADNIKYLPQGTTAWTTLRPRVDGAGTRFLETCRVLVGFKDRLVALNTIEDAAANEYPNRCRFSQNGNPTTVADSWIDDVPGRGGYIDAPTKEAIVTAAFIKDRLIVYFERSTWELVYTTDSTLPFRWQQINNELGAESTFSVVEFDKAALGVGQVGIHACDGVNVERIDQKIPNEVFRIHNGNDGIERVYGIRDYYRELVYWTFPSADVNPTFPTRVLVHNYTDGSWALIKDSFTCFGNFQRDVDLTWGNADQTYPTWGEWNAAWQSGQAQSAFPWISIGNQQGWVFLLDTDRSSNAKAMYITDMDPVTAQLTVTDHNLEVGEYVVVEDAQGITALNGDVFQVNSVVDSDTIILDTTFTGTYTGGGNLTRLSNISILSKRFNPGTPIGQQFRVPYVDFLLDATVNGEVSLDYLIDESTGNAVQDNAVKDVLLGTNVLYTRPEESTDIGPDQANQSQKLWHRYFMQTNAQFLQVKIYMTEAQMKDLAISRSDFQMHAMSIYVTPQGRITR